MDVAFQCPTKPVTPRNLFVNVFFHFFKFIEVGNTMFPQGQQKTTGFSPGKAVTFLGFVGFPKDR